jgi:hypothetical protein
MVKGETIGVALEDQFNALHFLAICYTEHHPIDQKAPLHACELPSSLAPDPPSVSDWET